MNRKDRLKQVMKDEAEAISKAADRIDYDILSQITELFCSVKKNGKKVIVAALQGRTESGLPIRSVW